MDDSSSQASIVVYLVDRPSIARSGVEGLFGGVEAVEASGDGLRQLLGPHDPNDVDVLVDDLPAGPAWDDLMQGLVDEKVHTVVTRLAPLSSGQRQQLIGVCAITGAKLVTPGNAGGALRG